MNFRKFARRCVGNGGIALFLFAVLPVFAEGRQTLNFNPDWKFIKADPPAAQAPEFADTGWKTVSAPHTYNDTDTFDDWSLRGHRGEGNQWGGRTWYRKTFVAPDDWKGKKVYIEFEAVRQFAEVYLNGEFLGISRNGFAPFGFDLTPHLKIGKPNVLAVMCDNRFMVDPVGGHGGNNRPTPNAGETARTGGAPTNDLNFAPPAGTNLAAMQSRVNAMIPDDIKDVQPDQLPWNNPHWHAAHGGIYRNVKLYVTDPVHFSLPLYSFLQTAGPYVYATDIVTNRSARVSIELPVQNGRKENVTVEVSADVVDRNGKVVLTGKQTGKVAAGGKTDFKLSGLLAAPELWAHDYPYIYKVQCQISIGRDVVDTCEVPLGIRRIQWSVDKGFSINGRRVKLRGWGQKSTDEWPGLGAAQPDWMHFYTLKLMKEAGGNWVRWGHTLGGPAHVEAADRLGILTHQPGVDGESDTRGAAWQIRSETFRDTIIYFRNNPSIVIWEGGNQKISREHARELRGFMDRFDPHGGRAYAHRRSDQITAEFMDVCIGTEGGREIRTLSVVEGEYNREESPRRVWDAASPPNFGYPEAVGKSDYVLTSEQFAVNQIMHFLRKCGAPDHAGGANWIFSDGTHGGRNAAEVARASGEVDGVRLPKEAYYVCAAMFRTDPQVHIIGHWTYPAGTAKTVYVVSNGDEVELFVNGKSIGKGSRSDRFLFSFPDVKFAPGEIHAVASRNGKVIARQTKRTAGAPVALRMTPITGPSGWQADGSDVLLIDVEAVDAKGERCPTFQERVDFELAGPGVWRGGYNSGKTNSINHPYLDLEAGINRVAVRASRVPGKVTVTASRAGLKSGSVSVSSTKVEIRNGALSELPPMPEVKLARTRPTGHDDHLSATRQAPVRETGRFIRQISYSGPTSGLRVERDAQNGKKVYADRDLEFGGLPAELAGADWVQALDADKTYNAVDLMEIAVRAGTSVYVAHDDRLIRPDWLTRQFTPTDGSVQVDGRPMKVFVYRASNDAGLTLGTNTENAAARTCNMYVVFVKGESPGRRE